MTKLEQKLRDLLQHPAGLDYIVEEAVLLLEAAYDQGRSDALEGGL